MFDQLLSEAQAASVLGVHRDTLRGWRKRGAIGYRMFPGGRIKYSTEDLLAFTEATKVEPDLGRRP
jgi:excisionase family DNA binding protein